MDALRIGIMGGTFDPIHYGHLLAAEWSMEEAQLQSMWFVPAGHPRLKQQEPLASPSQRMEMVRLAIEGQPNWLVRDDEVYRQGPTYAIDSVLRWRSEIPQAQFYWVIGSDQWSLLPQWHRIEELVGLCRWIVVPRGAPQPLATIDLEVDVIPLTLPTWALSATQIRQRLSEGKTVRYAVPPAVEAYMQQQRLYRTSFTEKERCV